MGRPFNAPDVFRAVAHPVRRRMLDLLKSRARSAGDLASSFQMTHATVSEHIRALRAAGLIDLTKRGTRHIYSLRSDRLEPIERWIRSHRRTT